MARSAIPKYRKHKTGQAFVRIKGKDIYLGVYDSPESHRRYQEILAQVLAGQPIEKPALKGDLKVVEAIALYERYARAYYVKDGKPTGQIERITRSLRLVNQAYGDEPAAKFGPNSLKRIRDQMIELDWCRNHINSCIGVIRRCWKWLVAEELLDASALEALQAVQDLRANRSKARETPKVPPVPERDLEETMKHLSPVIADMVAFQLLTGARPGEVCQIRPSMINRSEHVWTYRPLRHKGQHNEQERVILIGPRAQEILLGHMVCRCPVCHNEDRPHFLRMINGVCGECAKSRGEACLAKPSPLALASADEPIFSPEETMRLHREKLRAMRRFPVQPSQISRAKPNPARKAGEQYTANTYNQAVRRACRGSGVKLWHVHQLRHNAATRLQEEFGWEVARTILGHASFDATRIYVEQNLRAAKEAMKKSG